jgi:acetyltransferase-like isoleucine patch superfamily enzyme
MEPEKFEITPETLPILQSLGIRVTGRAMFEGNSVTYLPSSRGRELEIEFSHSGNNAILGKDDALSGAVRFWGPGNTFICEGSPNGSDPVRVDVRMASSESLVHIGQGTTSNGVLIVTQGARRRVQIGHDCMFAQGVIIRNADMHAIVDLSTWKAVNPQADVVIENHVWLGQDCMILRDVLIGQGSVIGAKSLVTKTIPSTSIAGGVPCKVLKSGFSWTRSPTPNEQSFEELRITLGIPPR